MGGKIADVQGRNAHLSMAHADRIQPPTSLKYQFRAGGNIIQYLIIAVILVSTGFWPTAYSKEDRAARVAAKVTPRLKIELDEKKLLLGAPVYMRIFKESNELELWILSNKKNGEYTLFRNYKICYWSGALGPKLKQGDKQSPEGFYHVAAGQMNPRSRYHLSFDLGYPNAYDKAKKRTGNYLMVHGACVSIGCYAMGNENIEEIYTIAAAALKNGQKNFAVHCFPFRMIKARMLQIDVQQSPWLGFWQNFHQAYQAFETNRKPPEVTVVNGRYVIKSGKEEK